MLSLLNVESMLTNGGILLLAAIVFAESGLLIGFFLPGDSLLFIAGFLASSAGGSKLSLPLVLVAAATMAIAGDQVGYLIGTKAGPAIFNRPKSRLFDPAHVVKAQGFFDRYGARTIVIARFVPIVRTFAPVVGGVAWGLGLPVLGYFLGQIDVVKNHIEIAVLAVVALSLLPMVWEFVDHRRSQRRIG